LPTRAQEFCSPSLQPSRRCKTHAFLPTRIQPSGQFYHIMTTPAGLSGLGSLDNIIITSLYLLNEKIIIYYGKIF